ncbi:GntR family transcriptional regulator [bacterium]|nr:GntR family transcriptional regulator [bacterium]
MTENGIDDIHATLRKRILGADYYPGKKLSENSLAKEFGCSRTPVREALKRLEHESLIEIRPQSGAYVRQVTTKDYTDLLEVRAYLEGLAFRLALERASDEGLKVLDDDILEMDRIIAAMPIDMGRYGEAHYRFHSHLVELAGNELLAQMFERLNLRASHMFLRSMDAESAARTQAEHCRIARQLAERDKSGEKFVIDHLWRKKSYLSY